MGTDPKAVLHPQNRGPHERNQVALGLGLQNKDSTQLRTELQLLDEEDLL